MNRIPKEASYTEKIVTNFKTNQLWNSKICAEAGVSFEEAKRPLSAQVFREPAPRRVGNPAQLTGGPGGGGVSGTVLWRFSAGTFPTPASVSLRTHPSAHLGSFSAGRSCMCWQKKNLLTCRRLVIFRFREKTLTNLSPQPVFPFPSSLLSPPLDSFGSLAIPSLRLFRIHFANSGI